jgi:hypothetical protein
LKVSGYSFAVEWQQQGCHSKKLKLQILCQAKVVGGWIEKLFMNCLQQ